VLLRDATQGLPADQYQFDCLFIDAAKGQYAKFLQLYLPLLRPGGLLITDNVLFRGLVAAPEEASKRHRPMVDKLREYNRLLAHQEELETSFLPVGDGLAVSIRKKA